MCGVIEKATKGGRSCYDVVSVRVGRSIPSTTAVHVSPGAIGRDSVSVPELTSSPAASGSLPGCRAIAAASSPRQSAGLRSEFRPDPSCDSSPFLSQLHREPWQLLDDARDPVGSDPPRLADDQRRMKPERGDEVDRLKLPVRKHAVDDLEPERQPFDRLEDRSRLERPWPSGVSA